MSKNYAIYVWVVIALLCCSVKSFATHTYGGELLYQYLSGTTYKITLTIYGDCSGQSFPSLKNATPVVKVYNNNIQTDSLRLALDPNSVLEVTPVCPEEVNNTACKGGTIPGVTKYVYAANCDIKTTSSNWRFVFAGVMSNSSAGRSNAITNLSAAGIMYLEAILNNTAGPNSSPRYTSLPTPFFCINKHQQFNQGATDTDNDSLYFSLTSALDNAKSVVYRNPYSATKPLAVIDSTFSFNNYNGQMAFTPNMAQTAIVVNKVEEYKNGVLVGSSMREMTFIAFSNCLNNSPAGEINKDITGGGISGTNTVNVCSGTPMLSFSIDGVDEDKDNILATVTSVPQGANVHITNNNKDNPVINFNWNTQAIPVGNYYMFVNYLDDGCPLSSNQTIAYTIRVVPPFGITHQVLYPTNCYNKQYVQFNITNGVEKKNITILKGNSIVATYTDSAANTIVRDSLATGSYILQVSSPYLQCSAVYSFEVADSGTYPLPPYIRNKHVCLHDPIVPIPNFTEENYSINWYNEDGSIANPSIGYNTNIPHTYTWLMTQQVKVCESVKGIFKITVHPLPDVKAKTKGGSVCLGDTVLLTAEGAAAYEWLPAYKVFKKADAAHTKVMQPGVYTVIGKSLKGCINTDSVIFTATEDCCTFSFPTAFTPNGDGKNDGFKPIMYGNESDYTFAVYNRWGQLVFITNNPRQYWDGTHNSKICDVGVYYYRFSATCLTGHKETKSGDVMLIR